MGIIAAPASSSPGAVLGGIALLLAGILCYFVPLIVAVRRHVRHLGSVAVVNIFLGWTVIGWVVALAMAFRSAEPVTRSAAG